MSETQAAERVLGILTGWAEQTSEVTALWLTGSFAEGTAGRFSDIDLRGCIKAEEFDYFASVESALSVLDGWEVFKRRQFSDDRPDSEIVVASDEGFWLDLHVVTPERLDATFVGPHPIRVLFGSACDLMELNAVAHREHAGRPPADIETRVPRAVVAWDFLAHAVAAAARGRHAYALSLLEGSRVALAQVLVGRTQPIPPRCTPATLPKFLSVKHQGIVDSTVPQAAIESIPDAIGRLTAALRDATGDLEQGDATGRLERMRRLVEERIRRERSS